MSSSTSVLSFHTPGRVRTRLAEHVAAVTPLHQLTLFPLPSSSSHAKFRAAILAFRFRSLAFQKKRTLPLFLARELLTTQKSQPSLSRRAALA